MREARVDISELNECAPDFRSVKTHSFDQERKFSGGEVRCIVVETRAVS